MDSHKNLSLPENVIRTNLGRGLGGDINGHIGRISKMEFGKFEFDDVICSWPDRGTFTDVLRKTGRQGTLGGGVLNRFTVVVDYFNGNLYYRKNRNFHNKFEYNMSGIEVKAVGQKLNHYLVSSIRKGSPASRLDIQIGDQLKMINGHETSNLDLGELNNFFRTKPGKRLRLELLRGKEKLVRKIQLERVI
jgi:hypothetical protein